MKLKTRRKIYLAFIILFFIVALPVLLYSNGWRLTEDLQIKKTGGFYVYVPQSGAELYLDGKLKKTTNFLQRGVFMQSLTPKIYSVIVAKEGFWPWSKNLRVEESAVVEAGALLMPQNPEGRVLLKGNFKTIKSSPYEHILMLFKNNKNNNFGQSISFYLPDLNEFLTNSGQKTENLLSSISGLETFRWEEGGVILFFKDHAIDVDFNQNNRSVTAREVKKPVLESAEPAETIFDPRGQIKVWQTADAKEIWAEWLDKKMPPFYFTDRKVRIFNSRSAIRSFNFLPKRKDVLVVAVENGVFALEIDGRKPQNFQPIYKGRSPVSAAFFDQESIYVLDDNLLSRIDL